MPQGRYSYRKSEPSEYQTRMESYRRELASGPQDPEPETWGHWFGHTAAPAAIRTVPAIGGGILGAAGGPLGVAGGGAAGAGVGSTLAQVYEKWLGDRESYSPGDVALDTALGAVPIAKYAKGAGLLGRAAIHGAQGSGMAAAQNIGSSLINRGELPTLGEVGESAAIGGVLGAGIGAWSGRARGSVVEPPNTSGRLLTGSVDSAEIGPPRNPLFKAPWDRPPRVTVEPGPPDVSVTNPNAPMGPVGPPRLPPARTPQLEQTPGRSEFPQRGLPAAKSPYAALPDKELEGLVTFGDEDAWQELANRGRVRPAGPSSLERKPIPMGPSSLPPEPEFPPSINPLVDRLRKSVDADAARPPRRQLGARQEIAPIAPEQPTGIGPVEAPRPVGAGRSMGAAPPAPTPPGAGILTRGMAMQVPPRIGQPVAQPPAVPGRPISGPRMGMPGMEPMGEVAPITPEVVGRPFRTMGEHAAEAEAELAAQAKRGMGTGEIVGGQGLQRTPRTIEDYDRAITALEDRLYNTDVGDDLEGPLFTKLQRLKAERGELIDSSPLPDEAPPMADVYPPRAAIPGFDSPNFPAPTGPKAQRMPPLEPVAPIPNPANIPGLELAQEPPPLGARARRRASRTEVSGNKEELMREVQSNRAEMERLHSAAEVMPGSQKAEYDATQARISELAIRNRAIHGVLNSMEETPQRGAAAGRLPFGDRLRDERGMVDLTGQKGIPPQVEPIRTESIGDVPPVETETAKPGLGQKISEKLKQAQEAYKKSRLSSETGSVTLEGKQNRKVVGTGKRDILTASGELPDERNVIQKWGNKVGQRLSETRTYKAGLDVSALLRQGGHFKTRKFFYDSLPAAYKTLMSQEGADAAEKELKKRLLLDAEGNPIKKTIKLDKQGNPIKNVGGDYVTSYERAKENGVYLSDEKNLEESIISKAAELGPFSDDTKAAKIYQDTIGSVYKRTNQFHGAFLNELRVRAFEKMSKNARPDEIAAIVKYINSSTGRGELRFKNSATGNKHDFEGAANALNKLFFSARFAKSRLDLMNPRIYKEFKKNPTVFNNAWRDLAGNVGYVVAANALAAKAGYGVTVDPRSPDFGKVKVGGSRIDFANGMQPYIRLLAQVTSLSKLSSVTGEEIPLNTDKFGAPTVLDTIEKFGEGKLAPLPAFLANMARGKQITGEESDYTTLNPLKNEFARLFTPMGADDIVDLLQNDPQAWWMAPLALGGDSLQTYGEQSGKSSSGIPVGRKKSGSNSNVTPRTVGRKRR